MPTKTRTKVPISERALIARINRRLKEKDQQLRRARGRVDDRGYWHEDSNLGRYFIIDHNRNFVVEKCVDLEQCGRASGALAEWERLVDENDES